MQRVAAALDALSQKAGFRVVPGLMERVAYRELFPVGLTVLDIDAMGQSSSSVSNALAEIHALFKALNLPVDAGSKFRSSHSILNC
jgi:chromosome partitioning protein